MKPVCALLGAGSCYEQSGRTLGMIRLALPGDAAALAAIYNHYIAATTVTFEVEEVTEEEMRGRVERVGARFPWLVWEEEGRVEGYAYAGALKERAAYGRTAETSVYVRAGGGRRGGGTKLYTELLHRLQQRGVHTAIGRHVLASYSALF